MFYVSSMVRPILMFAIGKIGASGLVDDVAIADLCDGVMVVCLIVWGLIEKRRALMTVPPASK